MSNEQRKLTYLRGQSKQLQEKYDGLVALVNAFQNETEEIAQYLLRRIRSGEDTEAIAELVRGGRLLLDAARGEVFAEHRILIVRGLCKHRGAPTWQRLTGTEPLGEQLLRQTSESTTLDQYKELLDLLIHSPMEFCNQVLHRIRQRDEIVLILRKFGSSSMRSETSGQRSPPRLPGLASLPSPWASSASQAGQGPVDVDPGRAGWTSVPDDDELVSHLIELYFTWQHVFFQNFPENLFRRDYNKGEVK